MKNQHLEPFIKWPGGKRWLFKRYGNLFPKEFNQLIDPFVGGGASLFYFRPKKAILSDINPELINTYRVMQNNHKELSKLMIMHQEKHNSEYYYWIRDSLVALGEIDQAARFLYLNRTCYNGMYRVNKQGVFNVPIGTRMNCIKDIDLFGQYAMVLKQYVLQACDFSITIAKAKENDLIFADPPYAYSKGEQGFSAYNNSLFSWSDQERLCRSLSKARDNNAIVFATNAYNQRIIELYQEAGFYIVPISRVSCISGNPQKRNEQTELLISSKAEIFDWEIK